MAETVEEATLQRSRVHFCRIFGVIPFCDRFLIDSIRGCEIFGVMLLLLAFSENNLRLPEETAKSGQKGQKKDLRFRKSLNLNGAETIISPVF